MHDIFDFGTSAYLPGAKAAVFFDSVGFLDDKRQQPVKVSEPKKKPKGAGEVEFMPWGDNNKFPVELMDKIHANVVVSSNVEFNAGIMYGDGIMVAQKVKINGKVIYEECLPSEQPEVFEWLQNNNYTRVIQENANDLTVFSKAFVELILGRDEKPNIALVRSKETVCSRVSKQDDKTGKILYHGYSGKWGETSPDDCIITEMLDEQAPFFDLKIKLGLIHNPDTGEKKKQSEEKHFILPLSLPVPGRFYYNKSFWWSIFKSGWYDFACSIPAFKKALIKNQMVLKYHIQISEAFWDKLFLSEGIAKDDDKKKKARRKKFLQDMNDFLSGEENAGMSFVSHFNYDKVKGFEIHDIIIKPVESFLKGGEYLEDSEEASNVICYAMSVHPSLRGASPGKNKNINGTEARELFIIKQAMTKPLRDLLVMPLYIAKELNGWEKDLHFVIPNIMLTTLDKGAGAEKVIGNQKV